MYYGRWSNASDEFSPFRPFYCLLEDITTFPKITDTVVLLGFCHCYHNSVGCVHQFHFSCSAWVTYSHQRRCWRWTGGAFTHFYIWSINGWHSQTRTHYNHGNRRVVTQKQKLHANTSGLKKATATNHCLPVCWLIFLLRGSLLILHGSSCILSCVILLQDCFMLTALGSQPLDP